VSKKQRRREQQHRGGRPGARLSILLGAVALLGWLVWWFQGGEPATNVLGPGPAAVTAPAGPAPSTEALTDEKLQGAADQLLALIDPERPENEYFSEFARDRLRWMVREHGAGRLQVAFLTDASNGPLPPDVLMAAWKLGDQPTIFIAKPRFMKFLIETGATEPPFTQQQKNDFALALVHEIVHLQNPDADPRDAELRPAEESRVWREVSLKAVRPLRTLNQPIHQRFRDVDDALRTCGDALPCPPLLRLVRTRP
jgi:hypothetical protein